MEDDTGNVFCCRGCRDVHDALGDEARDLNEDEIRDALGEEDETGAEVPEGCERAFLRVDGMHCSTCETFIESVAGDREGIAGIESSYVTETARIDYDPDRIAEDALPDVLSGLGYTAYDRTDAMARRRAQDRQFFRLVAGVLVGMMVMLQYVVLIYPVHFGYFYDERTLAFIEGMLESGPADYFFVTLFVLTSVVLFVTGGPLLRGAYVSLRAGRPNMDLLVSLAAVSAYAYSTIAFLLGRIDVYYDVTVAIVLVVTVGSYYEGEIKRKATELLSDLTTAQVDEARRYEDGETTTVGVDDLAGGDRVLVREGERVPVDGRVVEGEGTADEAVVTGESLPIPKRAGDSVVGGSVLADGALVVEAGEGATSSIDRISDLVWDLQSSNRGVQKLADKLATIFVPAVAVLAAVVAGAYLFAGAGATAAMLVGLTVLIVSCPCALGLATPLAVASSVREAMERGIVVFDDTVFERLRDVDVVVFDKTGTLTTGEMEVIDADGPDELFEAAAALERRSSHPVARAIVEAHEGSDRATDGGVAARRGVSAFESYTNGVGGVVDGTDVLVGHPDLFADRGWEVPDAIATRAEETRGFGRIPAVVGRDGVAEGLVVVGDEPREGWDEAVTSLRERDVEVVVLTGDDETAAEYFRRHAGVDRVFAGVPPEGKAETVRRLGATRRTAMVGDGTNDAPALASADLGIALGGGTALAADAADIAIVDDDLASIETVFDLARAARGRVRQNIGWAFCYNAIAIPLAITGLLNPLFAAVAMATSSLLVVTNSSRELLDEG